MKTFLWIGGIILVLWIASKTGSHSSADYGECRDYGRYVQLCD
jgi:hypothetical protein